MLSTRQGRVSEAQRSVWRRTPVSREMSRVLEETNDSPDVEYRVARDEEDMIQRRSERLEVEVDDSE